MPRSLWPSTSREYIAYMPRGRGLQKFASFESQGWTDILAEEGAFVAYRLGFSYWQS